MGFVEVDDDSTLRAVVNDFEGGELPVAGNTVAPVGATICRSGSTTGLRCGRILAKKFRTEVLAELPIVAEVREGGDEGRPISVRDPANEVSVAFADLAGKVARQVSILASQGHVDPSQLVQIGRFN